MKRVHPSSAPSRSSALARAASGALDGLYYGGVFSILLGIAALLDRSTIEKRIGASVLRMIAFQLAAGVFCGALAHVFVPYVRSRPGYWLFGLLLALPPTAVGIVLVHGRETLSQPLGQLSAFVIAILVGPLFADILRPRHS